MPQAQAFEMDGAETVVTGVAATLAPPSSPGANDTYIVPRGATGAWYLWDDDIAIALANGTWQRKKPYVGRRVFDPATGIWLEYAGPGSGWFVSQALGASRSGITASSTQTQGQVPLGHQVNTFSTVATTGDAATLPPARAGRSCLVVNDGANSMKVFPAAGDKIDAGSANASVNVAAGKRCLFSAEDDAGWASATGA